MMCQLWAKETFEAVEEIMPPYLPQRDRLITNKIYLDVFRIAVRLWKVHMFNKGLNVVQPDGAPTILAADCSMCCLRVGIFWNKHMAAKQPRFKPVILLCMKCY